MIAWTVFWIAFAIALAYLFRRLTRGEIVGDMRCKLIAEGMVSRMRIIVKRSGAETSGIPAIDFQVRVTLALVVTLLDESSALRLADLLDEAEAKVRAP